MPDPAGATPPLDEAGCAALKGFLEWVRDHSSQRGDHHQPRAGGLAGPGPPDRSRRAEPGRGRRVRRHLLAPFPAAQRRRERRSFGELLDWLDGHPLAMRLTLPRLDTTDPADLLAALRGTTPLPAADDPDAGRTTSLPASITYSYAHLAGQTRRLLPAVSLFHGVADEDLLMLFSAVEGVPGRFAGVSKQEWTAVLEDAARVGLLTGLGAGMYRIHPALPGYLAAGWHAEDPAGYGQEREACEQALCTACAAFSRWLTGQIESGNAALAYAIIGLQRRTLGAMLGHALDRHAWDDAERYCPGAGCVLGHPRPRRGSRRLGRPHPGRHRRPRPGPRPDPPARCGCTPPSSRPPGRRTPGSRTRPGKPTGSALAYLQDQPETEWTRSNISVIYHQLGITAQDRGRLDEADDWYRKALTINEELGDRPGMAITYHQLGITAQDRGRLDEAEDWYRKALTIIEELGDRPAWRHLPPARHTAQDRGRLDEAEDWYRKALTINEELGDRPGMAITYHQLGITAQDRGRLDEADDWYRKALTINEELGDRPGMAITYHQLGITAQHPRAAGRGRGLVPQSPHHLRRTRRPPRHGDHLPPARHDRPGPRAAGRGRGLVPQSPHHQRRTRRPPRHGAHLRAARPARRGPGPGPAGTGVEHPVRDLVRPVPQPDDRDRANRPGQAHPPARHASPGSSLAADHRPARAAGGPRLHHQPPRRRSARRHAMTDPAADAARSAAAILAPDLGPNLPAEVEAALAARDTQQRPDRYLDPVSLASLIVAIATLAWTIYNDQRNRTPDPPPSSIARQVRITLRDQDTPLPPGTERITEVVATEITRQASPPG